MNMPLHTPKTNVLAISNHTRQLHSNYTPHADAALTMKHGDQSYTVQSTGNNTFDYTRQE